MTQLVASRPSAALKNVFRTARGPSPKAELATSGSAALALLPRPATTALKARDWRRCKTHEVSGLKAKAIPVTTRLPQKP